MPNVDFRPELIGAVYFLVESQCLEGYFRISAFNSRENVEEAMKRITAKFTV